MTDDMEQRVAAERQRLADEHATPPPLRSFLWPALVTLIGVGIGASFTLVFHDIAGSEVTVTPDSCTVEAAAASAGEDR